ncbi:MAG: DsrE family protein [Actinobacteria bacterium]|nr:DsrE family protein [Actinomycetota bacterium]
MAKIGVVVLADTETPGDLGRVVNALITAREAKEAGDEVTVIFDGAGTKWIGELSSPGHKYGELLENVSDVVAGACSYCAKAFGVKDVVEATDIPLLADYEDHPSLRRLVAEGYAVMTF